MTGDRVPTRRRVLKTIGASAVVAGLAGCSGDGDDGGDGGDTPADEDTPAGDDGEPGTDGDAGGGESTPTESETGGTATGNCADLTAGGYTRYDEPDSPFVGTFEITGNVPSTGTVNNVHSVTVRNYIGDRQAFDIFPTQRLVGTDSRTAVQTGEAAGTEQVGEFEFGGETVPLIRVSPDATDENGTNYYRNYPYFVAGLPHEGSSGTKYYRMSVKATVQFSNDLEPTVCEDTFAEIAKHMLRSLEPNTDTTVEQEGV
jgi:hypothetical protein